MRTPGASAPEIQRADPRVRRLAIRLAALSALAGAALIASLPELEGALREWLSSDPARSAGRARAILLALGLAAALPLLLGALRAWRLGRRTLSSERFPPPGLAVVRDTPVRRGAGARLHGKALCAIAVALATAAILVPLLLLRMTALLR